MVLMTEPLDILLILTFIRFFPYIMSPARGKLANSMILTISIRCARKDRNIAVLKAGFAYATASYGRTY
jgi:hypothetical protein